MISDRQLNVECGLDYKSVQVHLQFCWGFKFEGGLGRTLIIQVSKLRKCLGKVIFVICMHNNGVTDFELLND